VRNGGFMGVSLIRALGHRLSKSQFFGKSYVRGQGKASLLKGAFIKNGIIHHTVFCEVADNQVNELGLVRSASFAR